MSLLTLQGRPMIERQQSGLLKITRTWKLNAEAAVAATIGTDVLKAYGTVDAEFATAYLVDQRVERRTEQGIELTLVQVFQELVDAALTPTTEIIETKTFDGRIVTRTTYLCKSSQATGLRPALGGGVFQVDIQKNGFVATVIKFDVELTDAGFVLSDSTTTRNNGKLIIRSIRTLGAAPATPAGFTLTSTGTQTVDGYTVYNSEFAKGAGRISSDVSYRQKGKLKVTTIRYLNTDDGSALTGELVNDDSQEQDGYTLYTKGYAEIVGDGLVTDDVETKESGKLVLYHRTRLGTAPATPAATIGGTVRLIQASTRQEDGFTLYDYRWAEGSGIVSTQTQDHLNGRVSYTVVRAFGTPSAAPGQFETSTEESDGYTVYISRGITINNADLPDEVTTREGGALVITTKRKINAAPTGSGGLIEDSADPREGYVLYTRRWAVGSGEISRNTDTRFGGMLQRTTIRHLTATSVGAQPTSDPFGTGGAITKNEQADQEGYRLWTVEWTKVNTTSFIVDAIEYSNKGKLVTYRREKLGSAPAAPTATISGTVVLVDDRTRLEDGFTVYSRIWKEGVGTISSEVHTREDGSIVEEVTSFSFANATPAKTIAGTCYMVKLTHTDSDGFVTNRATYVLPPATRTLKKQLHWTKPGILGFSGTQLTVSPPTGMFLLADAEVSYAETQDSTVPWTLSAAASFIESYTTSPLKADGTKATTLAETVVHSRVVSGQTGYGGYVSGATSVTGTDAVYNGVLCNTYSAVLVSSVPSARPTGVTVLSVDNDIYLVATDGTVVFRRTVASYTF